MNLMAVDPPTDRSYRTCAFEALTLLENGDNWKGRAPPPACKGAGAKKGNDGDAGPCLYNLVIYNLQITWQQCTL